VLDTLKHHATAFRLFTLAFLTLYLELALIRTAAAEVLYLGYFSNFVLIAVFLGIGLGFLLARRRVQLFSLLPQALLGLLAYLVITRIDTTTLREASGQLFFGFGGDQLAVPMWVSLAFIFAGTAFLFAALAQETGRCFQKFEPLTAYSLDIGGSLAGIVAFTVHAYLHGTPLQWFLIALAIIAVLSTGVSRVNAVFVALCLGLLLVATRPPHLYEWSPYQRIDVEPIPHGYRLLANGIGHQTMVPVGEKEPVYDYPYQDVLERRGTPYRNALVIGAGSGTDVSYALHYGVPHIDAVEIDPAILQAGQELHPEQPYADPRVTAYVTDGRAFMEHTRQRYDLIIYALPDSLASFSNLSNIRLESFLFTRESFQRAAQLLTDDGVLVLYNYYRRQWLLDKLASMLTDVFGHPPMVRSYTEEQGDLLSALAIGPHIAGDASDRPHYVPATDDWPFLYMQGPQVPPLYVDLILLFIGCGVLGVGLTGQVTRRGVRSNGPFFLMGAAFLLLETKSIIQFSLLFGATWLVNSLVFFAILVSVLLANLLVAKLRIRSPLWPFVALMVSLAVNIALPLESLLGIESFPVRYVVASAVLFSPIFCANVVFGYLFKDTPKSDAAFGWNLIGTMIGGALEYTSLSVGYHVLSMVVAALYLATAVWAFWLRSPAVPVAAIEAGPDASPG
jgi:hypothetical protein